MHTTPALRPAPKRAWLLRSSVFSRSEAGPRGHMEDASVHSECAGLGDTTWGGP